MTKFFVFLGRTGTKTQRAQFQIFATVRTKEVLGPLVHFVSTKKIRLSRCLCSISFSHQKRIDLFFAPPFCPSDHFTSAAEWQKFTRIGLGFAPDRLFCLSPPAPLSAYLSRQFQLECSRAIVVGGFDKRGGGLLTDKLPIDNRSSSSATGGSHHHDIAPIVHTGDQGQRILRIIFCQSKFQHLSIQIFYQSTHLRPIPIWITSTYLADHEASLESRQIPKSFSRNSLQMPQRIQEIYLNVNEMSQKCLSIPEAEFCFSF